MPLSKSIVLALAGMLLLVLSGASLAGQGGATEEKQPRKVAIPSSNPQSGEQMYKDYCAACHGPAGKGDGPAAAFLKVWPPDLTTLAQRNNGKFPETKVRATLQFGTSSHAHGTSDMPLWGNLFRTLDDDQSSKTAHLRVSNLTRFVESLQKK